ncbi:PAS domain S-box-containing protein [Zobellia uliginosa]|uniref:histidine kinase n=1 Tax=Zobellia uliginosa TaxID=143224 RepID=A0ABY1KT81_9FLAO|nr:PAS domain-containing sensor histidine kinase [Zobellia uliginosa]SIS74247.1 PAS domain S-box-containing protein [Zobellia uliginosa]
MKNHKNIIDSDTMNVIHERLRMGTWKLNVATGEYTLDDVTCDILQIPHDTVLKRGVKPPMHRPDSTGLQIEEGLKGLINSGTPFDHELEFTTPKGNPRWLHVIATRKMENGKCIVVTGIIQDITTRKQTENNLFQHNKLLNLAQKKARLGHWNWDIRTNTFSCSENMSRIIGFEVDACVSMSNIMDKVHPDDRTYVSALLTNCIKNKEFQNFTHRILRDDGGTQTIQVSGDVHVDDKGEIVNVLGISQDITDYKKIEEELVKKNELLIFAEQKALLGHWEWNIITDEVFWSSNLYYLFKQEENTKLEFNTYYSYVHVEDQAIVSAHFGKAIEEKHFEKIIHRIVLNDGTLKWILLLGEVIVNEQNEIIKLIGTCQDVTEQQMQEIKFKGLVESAPSATLIINKEGIIQMVNKQAESLFGYTPEELVEKSVEMLIPSRFEEKRAPHREKFLANPKIQKIDIGEDFYMIHKSGREIPVKVTLGPLHIEEGLLISMAIRDTTAQKMAERKILKAKEDLEILTKELTAQNHQLADFTQITSHNLRAPVSNLNSLLEIYKLMDDEEERKELFEKFEIVIGHLTLTLNTLVEALSVKNHTSIERSEIFLSETLHKTREIFTAEISRTKAVVKGDFSEVDSVHYNKIYLESIFQNLIGNALKYRSSERAPLIEISSEIHNGNVLLKFKDNGLGIDLNRHGHKMFGLNKVFHNHPEAKGIGLFMTKTQVEAMGGKIAVSSKVNEGSTFSITL